MDYMENRFSYLREKSEEELKEILEDAKFEVIEFEKRIKESNNSNEKLDLHNDIKFDNDIIMYIEGLLNEEKAKTK